MSLTQAPTHCHAHLPPPTWRTSGGTRAGAARPACQGERAPGGAAALPRTGAAEGRAGAALQLARHSARGGGAGRVGHSSVGIGIEAQCDRALLRQRCQLAVQVLQLQQGEQVG